MTAQEISQATKYSKSEPCETALTIVATNLAGATMTIDVSKAKNSLTPLYLEISEKARKTGK